MEETKTIETFVKMGLKKEEAVKLRDEIGSKIDTTVLEPITTVIQEQGDARSYHEFLHMAHFPSDIQKIIEEAKKDGKAAEFFGFPTSKDQESGLYIAGLGHDLSLTLTKKSLEKYIEEYYLSSEHLFFIHSVLCEDIYCPVEGSRKKYILEEKGRTGLEIEIGDQNKRFVSEHHRRSGIILSKICGRFVHPERYHEMAEVIEVSSLKLTKDGIKLLREQGKLYQTIPMIVDAVAHTKENYARGVAESSFVEDSIDNYLAGRITVDEAIKEVTATAEDVEKYGSKIVGEHKFNHEKMAERLAKKKNFPYLDMVRKEFPGVYAAIVASAESDELEKALQHKWYKAGVDGGRKVVADALENKEIRAVYELCKVLEGLDQAIAKYQPLFTGGQK